VLLFCNQFLFYNDKYKYCCEKTGEMLLCPNNFPYMPFKFRIIKLTDKNFGIGFR
jgi:hypothetical protein